MPREKSCGAVVFWKNPDVQYLLLHYGEGHWGFPRGLVQKNESEKETALRELEEETGLIAVKFIDGFRKKINYFYRREGVTFYKEVVYYLIEAQSRKVKLSYEHVGYQWLGYQDALERLRFKNAKNILIKAHNFLKKNGMLSLLESKRD